MCNLQNTESGRAFVEFVERPFVDRHGIENGLAKIRTTERVEAGIGGGPDNVAVPFDEDIIHGAVVASEFLQIATLRRNEIGHFLGAIEIADVVAAKTRDEITVGDEFLAWFPGRFEVWRIVGAKSSALET